jgi:hypothetical protein
MEILELAQVVLLHVEIVLEWEQKNVIMETKLDVLKDVKLI